jgi:hypothetical protein
MSEEQENLEPQEQGHDQDAVDQQEGRRDSQDEGEPDEPDEPDESFEDEQ